MTAELREAIRAIGPVNDLPAVQRLYEPILRAQPRDGVRVIPDVAYAEDERNRLDLYIPEREPRVAKPVVLVFPGGGFVRGDKADRENHGFFFARAGWVAAVANYRLGPHHRWPAGAEDVVSACRWARRNIGQYGGVPESLSLLGESAGAAHVATALLVRRFQRAEDLAIRGVVLASGVYNVHLERLAYRQFGLPMPDPRNEAYFGVDFAHYPAMSLVELIDSEPLPMLLSYAELDPVLFQVATGELFSRLVVQHKFQPRLHVIHGHNHLSQFSSVNTPDTAFTEPVLEFFTQHRYVAPGQHRGAAAEPDK